MTQHKAKMKDESEKIQRVILADMKFFLSIIGVIVAIVASYFGIQNQLNLINSKLDRSISDMETIQSDNKNLSQTEGSLDSRISTLEGILSVKKTPVDINRLVPDKPIQINGQN
jgi:hypothetical protein